MVLVDGTVVELNEEWDRKVLEETYRLPVRSMLLRKMIEDVNNGVIDNRTQLARRRAKILEKLPWPTKPYAGKHPSKEGNKIKFAGFWTDVKLEREYREIALAKIITSMKNWKPGITMEQYRARQTAFFAKAKPCGDQRKPQITRSGGNWTSNIELSKVRAWQVEKLFNESESKSHREEPWKRCNESR